MGSSSLFTLLILVLLVVNQAAGRGSNELLTTNEMEINPTNLERKGKCAKDSGGSSVECKEGNEQQTLLETEDYIYTQSLP
ncbi:hypothetical protein ACJIZ3_004778 [Penstemon smallii]|uniref:Phytosulfokine-beta n=1 Tax=Penstemon smallii TaxID=265156 RepID=A0ABD3S301_9LAMI